MNQPSVEEFIAAAREFCSFAEDDSSIQSHDLWRIKQWLLRLMFHMPAVEAAPHEMHHEGMRPSELTRSRVFKRFSNFSFNYYSVVFDPHNIHATDDPVMGMLADDLTDIYSDLAEGLHNLERGYIEDACFDWSHSYQAHWARHSANALAAIEIRRTDHHPTFD